MDVLAWLNFTPWSVYLTILVVVICVYYYQVYINTFSRRLGQPGPLPFPLAGYMPYMVKKGFLQCHIDWVKKYGKVIGLSYSTARDMLVADPDLLREIMTKQSHLFINRRTFVTQTLLDYHLLNLKDERWKHVRNVMTPTFSSGKLRAVAQLVQETGQTLVKNLSKISEEDKEFDVKEVFSCCTMDVIAATACGIKVDSLNNPDEPVMTTAKTIMTAFKFTDPVVILMFLFPKFSWVFTGINRALGRTKLSDSVRFFELLASQMVDERKQNEQKGKYKDFLQLLINANKELEGEQKDNSQKGLTSTEMHANILLFFLAGFDTTSQVLQFMAYLMATNPDWQDRVADEVDDVLQGENPDYDNVQKLNVMDMCLSETLRMYPPGFILDRVAAEDVTIDGHFFAKETVVTVPVWQIHHDPENYPDPDVFDPERFTTEAKQARNPYTYMPFGMGPRNCIGMRLAQMELKMVLAMIYQKYKFVTCEKTQVPLVIDKAQPIRPEKDVWLKLESRS